MIRTIPSNTNLPVAGTIRSHCRGIDPPVNEHGELSTGVGPYLYFENTNQVLRGVPLWAIFIGFVGLFFIGSIWVDRGPLREKLRGWWNVLPHFLGTRAASAGIDHPAIWVCGCGFDEGISCLPRHHQGPGFAPSALAGSHPVSGWIESLSVPGSLFRSTVCKSLGRA